MPIPLEIPDPEQLLYMVGDIDPTPVLLRRFCDVTPRDYAVIHAYFQAATEDKEGDLAACNAATQAIAEKARRSSLRVNPSRPSWLIS